MGRRSRQRIRSGLQPPTQPRARSQSVETDERIEDVFVQALERFDFGQGNQATPELAALVGWWTEGAGRSACVPAGLVPELVCSYQCREIHQAWERGWQPADIRRVVARRMSPNHVHLAVRAIAEESEPYRSRQRVLPAWLDQLDEIGAVLLWDPATDHLAHFAEERKLSREALLRTAFELIAMLHRLPDDSAPRTAAFAVGPFSRTRRRARVASGRLVRRRSATSSGSARCSPRPNPRSSTRRPTPSRRRLRSS